MRSYPLPARLALILLLASWLLLTFTLPTLDFDESLYRSVADSMRAHHNLWLLEWDGTALFHKPPLFYWLIVATSSIFDAAGSIISSFSARIPGLLASLGILVSLHFGMRALLGEAAKGKILRTPILAFASALFPCLTAVAVIFDPLQTLALMPALLIPARFFWTGEEPSRSHWFFFGLSLATASAIKGLNGIVIPTAAFGLHLLFHLRTWGFRRVVQISGRFLAFAFLPGLLLASAWFFLLDRKIGPGFTHEFFWVQHFSRAQNPMEAHGGGWFYHPLVIFFGGGFLTPLLAYLAYERRPSFLRAGFPLVFAGSFVLFFSLSATKLPHYTWPAWPALALFAGLCASLPSPENERILPRIPGFLVSVPVLALGAFFLFFSVAPEWLHRFAIEDAGTLSLIAHLPTPGFATKLLFLAGAAACFVFQIRRREIARSPALTAFLATLALISISTGLTPVLNELLIRPFQDAARTLKSRGALHSDCIRYSGAFSATFSLALAPELIHNRCEPVDAKYLVSPEWKEAECDQRGMKRISRHSWLVVCGK